MSKHDSTCAPDAYLREWDWDFFCRRVRNWHAFDETAEYSDFKTEPGVYVIFGDGVVQYVGSSKNIRQRLAGRIPRTVYETPEQTQLPVRTIWGVFREFEIRIRYSTKYGDWLMRELRLIRRLKPLQNSAHEGAQGKPTPRKIYCWP
jgi:hypothetical protein